MKRKKQNVLLGILLIFAVVISEIWIIGPKSDSRICPMCDKKECPLDRSQDRELLLRDGETGGGRAHNVLECLAAVPFRGTVERREQYRGKKHFFCPFLIDNLKFSRFYLIHILRTFHFAVAYCKSIVIRYIHDQDEAPRRICIGKFC